MGKSVQNSERSPFRLWKQWKVKSENSERSTLGLWKQRGRGKLIIARMEYRGYPHGVPEGRLPGEVRHLPGTRYYLYWPCDKNCKNNFWVAENNRIWTLLKLYWNKFFSAEGGKGKRQHPKTLLSLKNIPCRWLLSFVTESLYICCQDVDLYIYFCPFFKLLQNCHSKCS